MVCTLLSFGLARKRQNIVNVNFPRLRVLTRSWNSYRWYCALFFRLYVRSVFFASAFASLNARSLCFASQYGTLTPEVRVANLAVSTV